MPAVIFKTQFVYDWHIRGDNDSNSGRISKGDFLDYMTRPDAFNLQNHQEKTDEYFDFLEYMRNDDKSDGAFDSENNILSSQQLDEYRELERVSKSEGCPKYRGVISFENDFLRQNGILVGNSLNIDKVKDVARLGINALITNSKKLENDNVYWVGAIHTNTDNIHIHYSICEKHRTRNRVKTDRTQDCIELSAIKALKSAVANNIIGKTRSEEITRIKRQIIFPELTNAMGSAENLIADLADKLPDNIALQYGNHRMKPFQAEIDNCVDKIIGSNVKLSEKFSLYKSSIESLDQQYREFYGNTPAAMYSEHQLDDFYTRAGNMLLKQIKTMRQYQMSSFNAADDNDDKLEEKISAYAVSERGKNKTSSPAVRLSEELVSSIRKNKKHISNYYVSNKLENIINGLPDDTLQYNLDFLKEISDFNDTAAFAVGLHYLKKDNIKLAEQYLIKSSDNNNSDAQYQLGKEYLKENKKEKAAHYFRLSADNNNSFAQFSYGLMLYNSGNKEQGYHYLSKANENGNKIAHRIIMNLKKQDETLLSKSKSDITFFDDAEKSSDYAQYQLGKKYLEEDNISQAKKCFTTAAEQDNVLAQYQLGKLYLSDSYRDIDKAKMWLKRSADNGNNFAMVAYGVLEYKNGHHKLGTEYLSRAANNGSKFAQKTLDNFRRVRGSKPPNVRQAVQLSINSSQNCWYAIKRLMDEYDRHINKLQAEFDYENNISEAYDYDYSYD